MKLIDFIKNKGKTPIFLSLAFLICGLISQSFVPIKYLPEDGFPWLKQSSTIAGFTQKVLQTWDTKHFTSIASGGYKNEDTRQNFRHICGENLDKNCGLGPNYLYAFFPLFPLVLGFLSFFIPIQYSIFILAFLFYLLFAYLLQKFFNNWFKEKKRAQNLKLETQESYTLKGEDKNLKFPNSLNQVKLNQTFLLSLLMPFSVFFVLPYTETLYLSLFFVILILWKKQDFKFKNYLILFGFSFLLGLSRSVAVILPFTIFAFLIYRLLLNKFNFSAFLHTQKQNIYKFLTISAGIASAFLSFFYYGFLKTGDFFVSRNVQDLWGRDSTLNILEPFIKNVIQVVRGESRGIGAYTLILFCFFAILVFKKYRTQILNNCLYFLMFFYSIFAVILPLTSNSTASINRYILATPIYFFFIPLYVVDFLNEKVPQKYQKTLFYLLIFGIFLFFCLTAVMWSNHYWIG